MTTGAVLAQCLSCFYTETLETVAERVILTGTFSLKRDRTLRHRCGGSVRLWTGQPRGYRLRGVIL
jgi:hypothetical protein